MFEDVLKSIIDCIESAFSSITMVQGKNSLYVFMTCILFLIVAVILHFMQFYSFISIPESIIAVILSGLLTALNYKNTLSISNIRLKFRKGDKK